MAAVDDTTSGEAGRRFLWVGNALWLDFVNTEIAAEGRSIDLLQSDADVRAWAVESGLPHSAQANIPGRHENGAAKAKGDNGGANAGSLLEQARAFRQDLRRLAALCATREAVPPDTLDALNARLRLRQGYELLSRQGMEYTRAFHETGTDTDILFARLADSAADLLARGHAHMVRKCESQDCVLYFYDNSKNHTRRWCSMSGCGNRHKQQAHYQRKRRTQAAS